MVVVLNEGVLQVVVHGSLVRSFTIRKPSLHIKLLETSCRRPVAVLVVIVLMNFPHINTNNKAKPIYKVIITHL